MKIKQSILLLLIVTLVGTGISSCGDKADDTKPADAASEAQEKIEDMAEEANDAAKEVVDEAEEVAEDISDKAQEAAEEVKEEVTEPAPTGGIFEGKVVSLDDLVKGGAGTVSAAEAKSLQGKGSLLMFKSGSKVYMVLSQSGAYAGRKLAQYADKASVTIKGKSRIKAGVNYIIMESIE